KSRRADHEAARVGKRAAQSRLFRSRPQHAARSGNRTGGNNAGGAIKLHRNKQMRAPAGGGIALVLLCMVGLACDRQSPHPAPAKTTGPATQPSAAVPASYDLLEHPELVKDRTIPFTAFTVHGVRIGDPVESIPPDIIEARGTWRIKNKDLTLFGIQD